MPNLIHTKYDASIKIKINLNISNQHYKAAQKVRFKN